MNAIIYTTNTGSTEHYAKLLAQKTGLPVYSLAEAKKRVFAGAEDKPERKRTVCGKSRRSLLIFRCSPCKGTLMLKSCTASTAS
mgnify:CR=1 FL=1